MYFICIYAWIIKKKKSEKDLKINNGWFSRWSCQALQQAISLSCLDRKEGEDENKPFFFLKKKKKACHASPPPPINFILRSWTRKHCFFFFEVIWRTNCTIVCDISELGGWHSLLLPPGDHLLTTAGPRPCFYGLPECLRTFLVSFNQRDFAYSLPQFPSRSGHLQIWGQALGSEMTP